MDMSNGVLCHMRPGKQSHKERSIGAKNRFGTKLNREQETDGTNARTHQPLHDTIVPNATSTCGRSAESDSARRGGKDRPDQLRWTRSNTQPSPSAKYGFLLHVFLVKLWSNATRVPFAVQGHRQTWKPESFFTSVFAKTALLRCRSNVPRCRQYYPFLDVRGPHDPCPPASQLTPCGLQPHTFHVLHDALHRLADRRDGRQSSSPSRCGRELRYMTEKGLQTRTTFLCLHPQDLLGDWSVLVGAHDVQPPCGCDMKWVPEVTREQHDGRLFSFIIFSLTHDTQEKNVRFLDMRLGAKNELLFHLVLSGHTGVIHQHHLHEQCAALLSPSWRLPWCGRPWRQSELTDDPKTLFEGRGPDQTLQESH